MHRKKLEGLIHFGDASGPNYGRCLLALGEPSSPIAIDVNASEFLAVTVVHGNFPVPVLAGSSAMDATSPIRSRSRAFCFFGHGCL